MRKPCTKRQSRCVNAHRTSRPAWSRKRLAKRWKEERTKRWIWDQPALPPAGREGCAGLVVTRHRGKAPENLTEELRSPQTPSAFACLLSERLGACVVGPAGTWTSGPNRSCRGLMSGYAASGPAFLPMWSSYSVCPAGLDRQALVQYTLRCSLPTRHSPPRGRRGCPPSQHRLLQEHGGCRCKRI